MADIHDSRIIDLPVIADPRGNLSIIEQFNQIPFEIRRTYWIYDVPGGKDRGEHALKESEEFIVALSGSFDVMLDDGTTRKFFPLNRSYKGVLSSTDYSEEDYIEDYEEFKAWRASL